MALILSNSIVPLSPILAVNQNARLRSRVFVRSGGGGDSATVPWDSVRINGVCTIDRKDISVASYDDGEKVKGQNGLLELEPLWDDGYGTQTLKDYTEIAMGLVESYEGPPRWFCPVVCGKPLNDSPLLLYLPGN